MISFAILEQSRVILSLVFAGQAGRGLCIVIRIKQAPTQMIDETERRKISSKFAKRAARCNDRSKGGTVG